MAALTGLDIVVLLVVGGAAALGFMRGFVSETMSLAAWIVAILAVKLAHAPVASLLVGTIGTTTGAAVLAFVIVFGTIFFGVRLVGNSMGKVTRASLLGPFDRALGFGFGAVKGLIAATVAFLLAALAIDTLRGPTLARPEWMTTSRSYPLLRASGAALVDFVDKRRRK